MGVAALVAYSIQTKTITSTFNRRSWTLLAQKQHCCCIILPHQPWKWRPKSRISSCIYLYLADRITHRTHLWMHCVWLGLINTYNVVGNQASQACVIIGEHFSSQYWTKSLPPRCVSLRVCVREKEREREWGRTRGTSLLHYIVCYHAETYGQTGLLSLL